MSTGSRSALTITAVAAVVISGHLSCRTSGVAAVGPSISTVRVPGSTVVEHKYDGGQCGAVLTARDGGCYGMLGQSSVVPEVGMQTVDVIVAIKCPSSATVCSVTFGCDCAPVGDGRRDTNSPP